MERPIDVNVTNRGDAAATGPGLVLGTIGLFVAFVLLAMVATVLLIVAIPVVAIAAAWFGLSRLFALESTYQDSLKQMRLEDPRKPW